MIVYNVLYREGVLLCKERVPTKKKLYFYGLLPYRRGKLIFSPLHILQGEIEQGNFSNLPSLHALACSIKVNDKIMFKDICHGGKL